MTQFRIKKEKEFLSAEFKFQGTWLPLAMIHFRAEGRNTIRLIDMSDTMKVPLPPAEEKKRQAFEKKFKVREEFIKRFGTTPMRVL
ncbi:MAG: hypothetical protein COT15_05310 [Candidatus Diapherotrites archaeon CG08_land_8_20_14_0_20_34_12]|nr:MAG: hypothetical protein COT15_05310 [Candidatus Diapherotrites archaeon CG08_land_8_20_14_0_20_34_12]